MPPGLAQRLTWFVAAAAIGLLWAFGSTVTGRPMELHAHAVLGSLTAAALAAGGWDVAGWTAWRRDVRYVMTRAGVPPDQRSDLRALVTALAEQDPRVARALREAVDREG